MKLAAHTDPVIARTAAAAISNLTLHDDEAVLVLVVVLALRWRPVLELRCGSKIRCRIRDSCISIISSSIRRWRASSASWLPIRMTQTHTTTLRRPSCIREMYRDGALESELVSGSNPFLRRPKMEISAGNRERFQRPVANPSGSARQDCAKIRRISTRCMHSRWRTACARIICFWWRSSGWQRCIRSIAGRRADDELLKMRPI